MTETIRPYGTTEKKTPEVCAKCQTPDGTVPESIPGDEPGTVIVRYCAECGERLCFYCWTYHECKGGA